jgi:ferrous iron transport protein B
VPEVPDLENLPAAKEHSGGVAERVANIGNASDARDKFLINFALLGNPNTGKTTLFNRLCGLRAKTANFPGSTVEARIGQHIRGDRRHQIVDLPGVYGLHLDRPESNVCRDYLTGRIHLGRDPQALIVVVDATNLQRNLVFAVEALQVGLPTVVALNMIDLAQRRGLTIDTNELSRYLGVPIVPVCARSGEGLDALSSALPLASVSTASLPDAADHAACARWADVAVEQSVGGDHAIGAAADTVTDRLDAAFIHPVLGLIVFAGLMTGLFYTIFTLATLPMDLIEWLFASLGELVDRVVAAGPIRDMLSQGVIGGVAGTVVFLPYYH